jgi:hypothetical protein
MPLGMIDGERFAESVHDYVQRMLGPYREAIRDLEKRLEEVEAANLADAFKGTYDSAHHYKRGDLVTDGGSLWLGIAPNPEGRPGKSGDWRLVVKRGST